MIDYEGCVVVLDTDSSWIYIGTLNRASSEAVVILDEADAFNTSETTLTRHEYLMKVKRDGLVSNRRSLRVMKKRIVSISLLDDILIE